MAAPLTRKSILNKMIQVGGSAVASKALGFIRTLLAVRYLGAGIVSDAFWIAFKIPNMLRKTFAEGAISAALIPTFSMLAQEGNDEQISKLLTLVLCVVEGILLLICFFIFFNPQSMILLIAPGFKQNPEQLAIAVSLLRILIFFILFISTSALLAGAQQAKNHFLIPSWGPLLLNVVFIAGLIIGLYFKISIYAFALVVLLGGAVQLLLNVYMYCKLGFSFCLPSKEVKSYCISLGSKSCSVRLALPDKETRKYFMQVLFKFLPCVVTMSAIDINLLIDARFASFLPAGAISVIEYSTGFFRIPLGALGVALSTILLSHLSRTAAYAPQRLSYYLLESAKFIFWLSIPAAFFMSFVAYEIFYTTLLSSKFSIIQVTQSAAFLTALLAALPFFSLNKIILSIYYSQHSTVMPAILTLGSTCINIVLNSLLVNKLGVLGLAVGTSVSTVFQSIFYIVVLYKYLNFKIYMQNFINFLIKFALQFSLIAIIFIALYQLTSYIIANFMPSYSTFFLMHIGYWIWVGPLILSMFGLLYVTRKYFGIKIYYLD